MEDIGKVLYERVKANFDRRCKDHYLIKTISKRIANGKADMIDLSSYAGSLGAQLANAILDEVTQDLLPDGRLYYNIAKSIIEPMLRGNYDLINSVADELQASLDRKLSYRIKAQHAPFPQERVNTAIGAASQEGIDWETVRRRMSSTPENITHAMADDYMKVNAEFRSKAGIDTYIERRDDGKCCEWCSKLAGRYRYPEQVPRDVFRRHDNCGCLVSYVTPGGMRQNVHSKRDWSDEDQRVYLRLLDQQKKIEREKRLALGKSYKGPVRLNPKQAKERENEVLNRLSLSRPSGLSIKNLFHEYNNGQKDTISFKSIDRELDKSEIGREVKQYLLDNPCDINLYYNVAVPDDLFGEQDGIVDVINIYASNTKTVSKTAETIIHEVTHRRFDIGGDIWSECVCKAQEYKHKYRRNYLTIREKRGIIKEIKKTYSVYYPNWKWRKRK